VGYFLLLLLLILIHLHKVNNHWAIFGRIFAHGHRLMPMPEFQDGRMQFFKRFFQAYGKIRA
jgi:hypothetical protein